MPIDAVIVKALAGELSGATAGSRIDKIQQPGKDLLLLSLRGPEGNKKLLISAEPGNARIHLTGADFENPKTPPMFCMLLRKHIQGAKIQSVTQPNTERIIVMELDALEESGAKNKKILIAEMTGRNTNIILTGADGYIIDCLRKLTIASGNRHVLPNMLYRLPDPVKKPVFFDLTAAERREIILNAKNDKELDKLIFDSFAGLSPLVCREICFRAFGDASPFVAEAGPKDAEAFFSEIEKLCELVRVRGFEPCLLSEKEKPADFCYMRILQYEGALTCRAFRDFSSLLDTYFTERDISERLSRKKREIRKPVKNAKERTARKLENQTLELAKTLGRDTLRKQGELITANIYKIKKGDTALLSEDWFEGGSEEIEIPLDPLKTPSENAAKYFREYSKAKKAEEYLKELIIKNKAELEYLESVEEETDRASCDTDLAEITSELTSAGYLKNRKKPLEKKLPERKPLIFKTETGFDIYVGRNNTQNDLLTKNAKKTDIWLHAQSIPGSHVIVSCNGAQPDQNVIKKAAILAARYSQGRQSEKVPVDYTQVRFVKKPGGSRPGKVIYNNQKTIIAVPGEADSMVPENK